MEKEKEYERLAALELETSKLRHTTFTAILSISFILPGLALKGDTVALDIWSYQITIARLVFFLGYLFFLFSVFHYAWHHRYSHLYRKALKELEKELKINVYTLRVRPQLGPFKFHFDWALYVIGVIYGFITGKYVGWLFFICGIGTILLLYGLLLLLSYWQDIEPLE